LHWNKTTFYPLSPISNYGPSFPNAAPLPLKTLGVLLPITPENSATLWDSLTQKVRNKAMALKGRDLSLRGRVLVLKTLILSLVWYHASISPPPPNTIKQLQQIVTHFIWKGRHYHPKAKIASLAITNGGINLPIIQVETDIRLAKTISRVFNPYTPFWVDVSNHLLQSQTTLNNITQAITQKRSTNKPLEPLCSCLAACKRIEKKQPNTMAAQPPLPVLRNILRATVPAEANPLTFPCVGQISWSEIFHKHRHHPASDTLWLATWERLPIGRPLTTIAPDSSNCPWCPNEEHTTTHFIQECYTAKMVWDTVHMVYSSGTHSQPPPSIPDPSLSPSQHRLLCSTQSAALTTLWNAFTSRAFGRNPTPNIHEIAKQLLERLLSLRSLDLLIDPTTPWVPPNRIQHIITIAINRHTPTPTP